jgi:Leucine-rich repeat (LRR) protein
MFLTILVLITLSYQSLLKLFQVRQFFFSSMMFFHCASTSSPCAHCPTGAPHFVELNLSGTGVESVPDDIVQHLPSLHSLILDKCDKLRLLPVQLGALTGLQSLSVDGCTALLYPPKSVQSNPKSMAAFFTTLHKTSITWRRLKVGAVFDYVRCHGLMSCAGRISRQRAQRQDVHAAHTGQEAAAA